MNFKTVPTKNLRAGVEAFERVKSRRHTGTGALCLVEGPAGSGKTSYARVIAQQYGGVVVRARQTWSPPSMLNDILGAIIGGHVGYYSANQSYCENVKQLQREPLSCLVIDEADYLDRGARHELLNVLRDLSDETENTPIIFLSVQSLARRLATPTNFTETVSSRIAAQVRFERLSLPDASLLARELIEGVTLERDIISYLLKASGGSIRRLVSLYADLEDATKHAGVDGSLNLSRCESLGIIARPQAPAKAPASESNQAAIKGAVKAA